jgi:hypothetical protein
MQFMIAGMMALTHPHVRWTTAEVYCCLKFEGWPSKAGVAAFGIDSTEHLKALQYAVREQGVTPEQLDEALGDGTPLTALIQSPNQFHGVKFETTLDRAGLRIIKWADVGKETIFPLGYVHATVLALEIVPREQIIEAVRRHAAGDWGIVDDKSKAANEAALKNRGRLCSWYEVLDEDGENSYLPACVVNTHLEKPATFVATLYECRNAARRTSGGL